MLQTVTSDKLCRACANIILDNFQEDAFRQFQKFRNLYSALSEMKVSDDDDLPEQICPTCVGLLETVENFKESCVRAVDSIRKLIVANLKEEPIEEYVSAEALEPFVKVEMETKQILNKTTSVRRKRKSRRGQKRRNRGRPICAVCGKTFVDIDSIRKHMKLELKRKYSVASSVVSKSKVEVKSKIKLKRERCKCTYEGCSRNFLYQRSLNNHYLKMHKNGPINLACPTCKRIFASHYILKKHILQQHADITDAYTCETCNVRFVSESHLKSHNARVHLPFVCHHCGATSPTKTAMRDHLFQQHAAPVYHICAICHVKVEPKRLLWHCARKHTVKTDDKVRSLKCRYCDKEYERTDSYKRHLKSHVGDRKHVCHECGKSFVRAAALTQHFYVHSGKRPVHCEHCEKGFYNNFALKIHMNVHKREWMAQGQTGIELLVYPTSNKSKNSVGKKYANLKQ